MWLYTMTTSRMSDNSSLSCSDPILNPVLRAVHLFCIVRIKAMDITQQNAYARILVSEFDNDKLDGIG